MRIASTVASTVAEIESNPSIPISANMNRTSDAPGGMMPGCGGGYIVLLQVFDVEGTNVNSWQL